VAEAEREKRGAKPEPPYDLHGERVTGWLGARTSLYLEFKVFAFFNKCAERLLSGLATSRYVSWRDFPFSFSSERPLYTNPRGRISN
jgi:hypothetical protein